MGVNWAAGLMRWNPHFRPNGEVLSLTHLHPFRFDIHLEADAGRPAEVVSVHVGFSSHVFTSAVENAGAEPELYFDRREVRAFDHERYNWSSHLKGIVTELDKRKCYFARRDCFVTVENRVTQPGHEYRVFFTMRRKDGSTVELVVQSAYIGEREVRRPHGQAKRPILFRSIVRNVISKRRLVEAP